MTERKMRPRRFPNTVTTVYVYITILRPRRLIRMVTYFVAQFHETLEKRRNARADAIYTRRIYVMYNIYTDFGLNEIVRILYYIGI